MVVKQRAWTMVMAAGLALVAGMGGVAMAQVAQPTAPAPAALPTQSTPTAPQPTASQPDLQFDSSKHDFGLIPADNRVTHVFKFTNKGQAKLVIQSARGSCGCTVPALTKTEYEPGESGEISVEFNPHGREGIVNQQVTVQSNDPDQPMLNLAITSNVDPIVKIEPKMVQMGKIEKGAGAKAVIEVTGKIDDFKVMSADVFKPDPNAANPMATLMTEMKTNILATEDVEVDGRKLKRAKIEVTLPESAKVGRVQQSITVITNDPKAAPIIVPVMGDVTGDLEVAPPRVSVGLVPSGKEFSGEAKITHRKGKKFKVSKVEQGPSVGGTAGVELKLNFEIVPSSDETFYTIKFKGTAPTQNARVLLDAIVSTDVDGEETQRIGVYVVVRGAPGSPVSPAINTPAQPTPSPSAPGTAPASTPASPTPATPTPAPTSTPSPAPAPAGSSPK